MIAALVYGLTAIALLVAVAWAARGLYRELASDLREDLAYAGRRFRGLRIVFRGRHASCEKVAANTGRGGRAEPSTLTAANRTPRRSTNGHRLRLVDRNRHPLTIITMKGGSHGC